ncbi:uncharacterized protein LOC111377157 [Olea europaea var. sylvestris]|uniref:uncharacterized protein LOC111377157 n=1 Tax=Olea europaea var. sylvestris TaxID=158386 RepID=UPI000C1D2DAD|nr:uncharacterized protein LOC111377157 [Olea europaea var. sylvestris]
MTQMSLRGASFALKCRAFHLTLGGAAEVWYNRLPPLSTRSWPDLKNAFLNQYLSRREGEAPMQHLQDMRQAPGETLKSYLSRFTDEIKVTDREALSALKGTPSASEVGRSRTRSIPCYSAMDSVPVLAYENAPGKVGPSGRTDSKKKKKKRSNRPLEGARFCTFHQLYEHDINECRDAPRRSDRIDPHLSRRNDYYRRFVSPNRRDRRHREQSPRKKESRDRGEFRQRDQATFAGGQVIREIDTIIGRPHIGGNTRNAQRNYTRETNDPPMITYIVNESQEANRMAPISFSQENAQGVHHPHCDALVVRAVVARNGLKRMLVDSGSSMNKFFNSTFNKMQIEHGLIPMTDPLFGFTGDSIVAKPWKSTWTTC